VELSDQPTNLVGGYWKQKHFNGLETILFGMAVNRLERICFIGRRLLHCLS
jgi:hypothetical protein